MKRFSILLAVLIALMALGGCGGGATDSISSVDDLADKTFGVLMGTTAELYASRIESAGFLIYVDAKAAVKALEDAKIDALITDFSYAKILARAHDDLYVLEKRAFEPEEYRAAVRKGNNELHGVINVVFEEIKTEGTLNNLLEGYIHAPDYERSTYISGEQIGQSGVLTVGTCPESAPFSYKRDGAVVGLEIEIAKLIAKKLDKTLVVVDMSSSELIPALQNGAVDFIMSSLTETEANAAKVDFTNSYYTSTQAIILSRGTAVTQTSK